MPAAGVLQEFLVSFGFKVDQTGARQFSGQTKAATDAARQLQSATDALAKTIAGLGRALQQTGDEPVRKYGQAVDRIGKWTRGLSSELAGAARIGVTMGAALATAVIATARNYEELYLIARRTGQSIGDLQAFKSGFDQIAGASDEALASLERWTQLKQFQRPIYQMLAAQITPADRAAVRKAFGDLQNPVEEELRSFMHHLGVMVKTGRGQYAMDLAARVGITPKQIQDYAQNEDRLGARTKAAGEILAQVWGGAGHDAKTAAAEQAKAADQMDEIWARWSRILLHLEQIWDKTVGAWAPDIIEIEEKFSHLLDEFDDFAERNPLLAAIATAATATGGFLGALRLVAGLLGLGGGGILGTLLAIGGAAAALSLLFGGEGGADYSSADEPPERPGPESPEEKGYRDWRWGVEKKLRELGAGSALDPIKSAAEAGAATRRDIFSGQLFRDIFEALFGKSAEPAAPAAPGADLPPSFQHGGIVPIAAHPGEMVLPSFLSAGFQRLFAQHDPMGDAARAWDRLIDWLGGVLVPKVEIENPEDIANRAFPGGVAGGGGRGGGGGAYEPLPNVPATPAEQRYLALGEKYESGGRNVMQGLVSTAISTAQGFWQITNQNWHKIAPLLGITAPNAMAASREDQYRVALYMLRHPSGAGLPGLPGAGNWAPSVRAAYARGEQAPSLVAGLPNLNAAPLPAGGGGNGGDFASVTYSPNITINGAGDASDAARRFETSSRRMHDDLLRNLKGGVLA